MGIHTFKKSVRVWCFQFGNFVCIISGLRRRFTGSPHLSPYHSDAIWKNLFLHIDPVVCCSGADLRDQIGDLLFKQTVR